MLSTIVVVIAFVQLQVMVSGLSTRPNETNGQLDEHNLRNGPSVSTKVVKNFLDCNKCFGHGQQDNPDPRCRFGCGRVMTYPPTEETNEFIDESYDRSTEFSSTAETFTESVQFAVKTEQEVTREPVQSESSFLSEFKSWKGMLGLGVLLIATIVIIIYVVYQKKAKPQTKLATFNWAKSTDTIATLA